MGYRERGIDREGHRERGVERKREVKGTHTAIAKSQRRVLSDPFAMSA